jgi:hypothetical protein
MLKNSIQLFTLIIVFFFIYTSPAFASVATVCPSGTAGQNGCDYIGGDGIQQAIDSIENQPVETTTQINLKPGKYQQVKLYVGFSEDRAPIEIRGENAGTTILEGDQVTNVIYIFNTNLIIENLTITNGLYAGIEASGNTKVKIHNSYLKNNQGDGVALYDSSSADITNSIISNNEQVGIYSSTKENLSIKNNLIANNLSEGVRISSSGTTQIINNVIDHNVESGINIYQYENNNPIVTIKNNIITNTGKSPHEYSGYGISGAGPMEDEFVTNDTILYNLTWNNASEGTDCNFSEYCDSLHQDPKFVSNTDFHLQPNSPAINAGDPSIFDHDGSRSDMGMYGGDGNPSTSQSLDLDNDGDIDRIDFEMLKRSFSLFTIFDLSKMLSLF